MSQQKRVEKRREAGYNNGNIVCGRWERMEQLDLQCKPRSRYEREKYVNILIMKGEEEALSNFLSTVKGIQSGNTSFNPVHQQRYDCIIGISMAVRAAMEGGMKEEDAYILGDTYIRRADELEDTDALWKLYQKAILDFTGKVKEVRSNVRISEAVRQGMEYIQHHIHCELTLKEIADYAKLSETYFSALFKKETGETVSGFILRSRIEEAKGMLCYSDDALSEIAKYLGFCSQSHFSKTFRQYTDMTPGEYRKCYYKRTNNVIIGK